MHLGFYLSYLVSYFFFSAFRKLFGISRLNKVNSAGSREFIVLLDMNKVLDSVSQVEIGNDPVCMFRAPVN